MEETPQHTIFASLDLVKISWWIQIRVTCDTFALKKNKVCGYLKIKSLVWVIYLYIYTYM